MLAKTYGEILNPVMEIIDQTFPEGRDITRGDLKVVAYMSAMATSEALRQVEIDPINKSEKAGK